MENLSLHAISIREDLKSVIKEGLRSWERDSNECDSDEINDEIQWFWKLNNSAFGKTGKPT